jgi:hypothetical protein
MLQTLDFNITVPSVYRFLERFIKLSGSDDLIFNYARYIAELTLLDVHMYRWKPSEIAASAIFLARKILQRTPAWSPMLIQEIGYDE